MNVADMLIIAGVVALLAVCVRSLAKGARRGCAGCASKGGCSARLTGGRCDMAARMVAHADEALGGSDAKR